MSVARSISVAALMILAAVGPLAAQQELTLAKRVETGARAEERLAWLDELTPAERTTLERQVQDAEARLAHQLEARGAKVLCVRLPAGADGQDGIPSKMGLGI